MSSNHFFDICFAESFLLFNMFRHTGFTESYESMRKWDQNTILCFCFNMFCQSGFTEWYESLMESHDFAIKSTKQLWRLGTQKNNVNMIFECDASRLVIYISWGHRDTVVCFWKSSNNSENCPTSGIKISARSPIFAPKIKMVDFSS